MEDKKNKKDFKIIILPLIIASVVVGIILYFAFKASSALRG